VVHDRRVGVERLRRVEVPQRLVVSFLEQAGAAEKHPPQCVEHGRAAAGGDRQQIRFGGLAVAPD
jgi:hypothetical protein